MANSDPGRPPERLLLGPGPSPVSARVMQALASPVLSHLDPFLLDAMDDLRTRLARVFRAPADATALAISGTGTSAMEAAVANLTQPGTRALVIVTGYFGDRLAQMLARYGADVHRLDVEWGRAVDPARVAAALDGSRFDIVGIVHAETSTGVLNPVDDVAKIVAAHDALLIVDAVTSLGAMPVDVSAWGRAVCYSCAQKGLGAPSGLSPIVFTAAARERLPRNNTGHGTTQNNTGHGTTQNNTEEHGSRSFYFDLELLEDYWIRRKYHHTISSSLVLALREAVMVVEEEGLDARLTRHRTNHEALVGALDELGLTLLPPPGERLWTLNAVRVPDGVDEAAVRKALLQQFGIEIGAGLGPLAGKIWRVGLMGSGSTAANVLLFIAALSQVLQRGR